MLDDVFEELLERIGVEVCQRIGVDAARWKKYLPTFEDETIRWETRKVLARLDASYDREDFEPLENPILCERPDEDEPCI
jgi:hypothetical protein